MGSVHESYRLFQFMQCHFSGQVIKSLFPDMFDHMINKWDSSGYNIVLFLNRLDAGNTLKVLDWGQSGLYAAHDASL